MIHRTPDEWRAMLQKPPYRTIRAAKRAGICRICGGQIEPGDHYRARRSDVGARGHLDCVGEA